jgi:predicted alpha/beta-hydrolase family hydrolase
MAEAIRFEKGDVRGFLHQPDATGRGLVLTHGAGGNANSPLLVELAKAFCAAGVAVLRCDLPFRQHRPSGPPWPASAAADRAGLRNAVEAMRDIVSAPIILGGQSYGGRQATMLAADDPTIAETLLALSYPLHPPGKPERLRTEHFPRLRVRTVFVHGTADPFASSSELESAASLIPAATEIVSVEGAGHDLRRGRFDLAGLATLVLSAAA